MRENGKVSIYYDGINLEHDRRHKVLANILELCESEKKKWVRRCEVIKISGISPTACDRHITALKERDLIKIDPKKHKKLTRIFPKFATAKRELHRMAKKNVTQSLPYCRVAGPDDVIGRIKSLDEKVTISDSVSCSVVMGRLHLFMLFLGLFFRHTIYNNCINHFLKVSYFGR